MNACRTLFAVLLLGFAPAAFPRDEPVNDPAKTLAKLSKERVEAAHKTFQVMWENYREGRRVSDDTLYRWSLRWLEAERQLSKQQPDQVAAYKGHRDRMAELERLIRKVRRVGQGTVDELSAAEFYKSEAEIWLLQAEGEKKGP